MMYYAIVNRDNVAINFIIWDEANQFDYGQQYGNYLLPLDGIESYGIGWIWNGSQFVNPNPESQGA